MKAHRRHEMVSAQRARTASARMVKDRPDWVLSRQRAWGVPLAIFVNKKTQRNAERCRRQRAHRRGLPRTKARTRGSIRRRRASSATTAIPTITNRCRDILDVWFDSGSTHVFTVEQPIETEWPKKDHADLYLEGSDQHRGWFQSSLLESCGTRGRAPYDAVLTHGFVLDAKATRCRNRSAT